MVAPVFFNQYFADKNNGVHDWSSHTFRVAFCNAANAPVVGNSVLANLTTVSESTIASTVVTVTSSTQTAGVWSAVLADRDIVVTGTMPTWRYIVLYNDTPTTPADPLVYFIDTGVDNNITDDTYPIDFAAALTLSEQAA
ncbi:hypothetical protein [Denitrobaculum tricleocarpae]|uniref:Uncharacterized protein n=1 Tax=Denitrobaculum tricleocarpae TaxID=2591009 RepID=A0A545TSY4_9PROT|nr:hypothetical protein [Denitrobaculum tricleocarpae]TQV80322.1 hypothetical protein FKG95_09000 [Denitrobaculum tricleocarpae]